MENIVLYPSPGIGHLISMVELGKLLLSQSPSTSITILISNFPFIKGSYSSYISSVSFSFPSITFLSLPSVPLLQGDPSNYDDLEQINFETLRTNKPNLLKSLTELSNTSPIKAFILDFFCYPAVEISKSLNIPTYFFFTCGASALCFFLNFPVYDKIYSVPYRKLDALLEIPGLFSVPASHMIEPMLDRGESYHEFIKMAEDLRNSNGIIVNTFELLEVKAVKGLKQGSCLPGFTVPPVYCVGPLIANRADNGKTKDGERDECLNWLDLQPSQSVVYLGFGSRGMFCKEQLYEIAVGLEKSGVRFLWVVRAPPGENQGGGAFAAPPEPDLDRILPEGFLERTKDRGLVVKSWVPQIEVLGHESVGGFVTHCGWNSILEAVDAGVPMVAWPLYAEQRFNKIFLVEEVGIAVPINESEDRFVSSTEIETRVKEIMDSDQGRMVRKRVTDLKEKAYIATADGGSSNVALSTLIESWKQ